MVKIMFEKFGEILSSLSRSDWVAVVVGVVGIVIGFVTATFSTTDGVIIFSACIVAAVVITVYYLYDLRNYGGLYEVLEKESRWEFLDSSGTETIHNRRLKVRFIQNGVIAIADSAYGDGDLFAEYDVEPGKVVDKYRSGPRTNALISLGETKNRGDLVEFKFRRKVLNGFTSAHEWIDIETDNVCRRLSVVLIFPRERRCQRATLTTETKKTSRVITRAKQLDIHDRRYFANCDDGRQQLSLDFPNPRTNVKYTIRWDWAPGSRLVSVPAETPA